MKNLWNQTRTQLIIHNKTICKSQNLPILGYLLDKCKIHMEKCSNSSLNFFHQNKLKLKKKIEDYNINEELKLQINYYENKNWKVINWYNNWIKLIQKSNKIIFLRHMLKGYLQQEKKVPPQQVARSKFPIPTPFVVHVIRKDKS